MSVMPPEIPRDVADLAKKEWTNPQTYFENMSTPIVSERISKESIALWESKEPKYFAQSMDRTIWMLVLNASHDSPRVETYQTTLYRILAERGSEAVTRSLRRHSDFVSKDVNVLKEYLERLGFMLKKNEKMMQPDIIREVAESKRDEMLKRIRSKRDSIRTMKRLLNMKVETESKNVPNAKDLLKIQFKKVSEDITNSRLETNTVWSAESCISLRAHVMQSSLENEGIERNVRSRVEILEQELKRPARVDDMIAKSKKDIGMLLKRLELVKEQEKKRQKVLESVTKKVSIKSREYHEMRKGMTPRQLKRLDPEFQRSVRDQQVRDLDRIESEMRRVMSMYRSRRDEIKHKIRIKIRQRWKDELKHLRIDSRKDFGNLFQDFQSLSREKRFEASKKLIDLKQALEQKTEECRHLRWTLRERVVQLEQTERERESMILGLREVKFDRDVRRKRLRELRSKMKRRWIERKLESERYVSLLLKCCAKMKIPEGRSELMDVMIVMIEKLKIARDEMRRRRKRIML